MFTNYAQDKTLEIKLNKKEKITDYGLFNADTFLLSFSNKGDESLYTLIDSELNIQEERISKLYPFDDLEEDELYGEMNRNYYYSSSTTSKTGVPLVSAHKSPGSYGVSQTSSSTTSVFMDIRNISFYNSNFFVLIGRKDGEAHYFRGECEKSKIYIYTKNIQNSKDKYVELEIPESKKKCKYPIVTKLLYYDDSNFHLVFNNSSKEENKYLLVKYNYRGEVLSEYNIINEIRSLKGYGHGYLNHYSSSFSLYQPHTINPFYDERMKPNDHAAITNNQFSGSLDRSAEIIYDHINDELYLYSTLYDRDKKESAILITKYNNFYKKVWSKTFYEKSLKLPILLSDYKISKFFVKNNEIHINLLATFNNKFNRLYVLKADTGELKFSKMYKKPDILRKSYHGFRSPFIVKENFGKNIGVNTPILNFYESYKKVKKYIDSLNKKEDMMLFGYYVKNGVVIIKIPKKNNIIEFNKFEI